MAASRTAAKNAPPTERAGNQMPMFVWEGTDKRGIKMKGEQQAKNGNRPRGKSKQHPFEGSLGRKEFRFVEIPGSLLIGIKIECDRAVVRRIG